MSFFGLGQRQPTSDEKIAMVESEITSMMDLQTRYASSLHSLIHVPTSLCFQIATPPIHFIIPASL
jgi:hypothetical protein